MEEVGSQALNLAIGKRLVIIIVFLCVLWFVLNYLTIRIKSGELKLPNFLKNKFYGIGEIIQEIHQIKLIQRKHLVDGCEMLVVDVDGAHLLLAKNLNGTLVFIKELDHKEA